MIASSTASLPSSGLWPGAAAGLLVAALAAGTLLWRLLLQLQLLLQLLQLSQLAAPAAAGAEEEGAGAEEAGAEEAAAAAAGPAAPVPRIDDLAAPSLPNILGTKTFLLSIGATCCAPPAPMTCHTRQDIETRGPT
jgi:hypothetical protein